MCSNNLNILTQNLNAILFHNKIQKHFMNTIQHKKLAGEKFMHLVIVHRFTEGFPIKTLSMHQNVMLRKFA